MIHTVFRKLGIAVACDLKKDCEWQVLAKDEQY